MPPLLGVVGGLDGPATPGEAEASGDGDAADASGEGDASGDAEAAGGGAVSAVVVIAGVSAGLGSQPAENKRDAAQRAAKKPPVTKSGRFIVPIVPRMP